MAEERAVTARDDQAAIVEQVIIAGDLSKLAPADRVRYYQETCRSLGLNPLTRPFDYIVLNGKLTLYAKRDATDQLRKVHRVSVSIVARERLEDLYVVTARATLPDGRTDESIGAVSLAGLKGDTLANAIMKAETKAKRRVTLSIVGLGWLDETEVASVPDARAVRIDDNTGEIVDNPPKVEPPRRHPKWSEADQAKFTELVLSDTAPGMGLSQADLNRLLPELSAGTRLSDLGTVDQVITMLHERMAQQLSDGGDTATEEIAE
jgi:hypothetical protein